MGLLIVGFILSVVYPNYGGGVPLRGLHGHDPRPAGAELQPKLHPPLGQPRSARTHQLVPGLRGLDNQATPCSTTPRPGPAGPPAGGAHRGCTSSCPSPTVGPSGSTETDGPGGAREDARYRSGEGAWATPAGRPPSSCLCWPTTLRTHGSEDLVQGLEAQPGHCLHQAGRAARGSAHARPMAILTAEGSTSAFFRPHQAGHQPREGGRAQSRSWVARSPP